MTQASGGGVAVCWIQRRLRRENGTCEDDVPPGFTTRAAARAQNKNSVNFVYFPQATRNRKRASSSYHIGKFVPQVLFKRLK